MESVRETGLDFWPSCMERNASEGFEVSRSSLYRNTWSLRSPGWLGRGNDVKSRLKDRYLGVFCCKWVLEKVQELLFRHAL